MIINVRGTSGSGKTWVMKKVMETLGHWEPIGTEGRKKPLYYVNTKYRGVIVLGHYESMCGGCDNVGSAKAVYDLIQDILSSHKKPTILCEGLLLSEDTKWCSQLEDLRVIYLITPLSQCLKQIEARRASVGNEKPLNPANTTNRIKVIERSRLKLKESGIIAIRSSVNQAPSIILKWIKGK
jgi:hypothetical protein